MSTYQELSQYIRDMVDSGGVEAVGRIEAMLAGPSAAVTDRQIALLRAEMEERLEKARVGEIVAAVAALTGTEEGSDECAPVA